MSERITADNLDEVIKRNEVIEEQMKQSASLIWSKYNPMQINKDYLLPQEIGIITKGKGDSVQERMKSATIRFEKSCIEDKWKLKL